MNTNAVISEQRRRSDKQFTILCIDDETSNLKILASIFKDHHNVIASKSAHQGLQKALDLQPDLILLDVLMPGKDGFEICQILKDNSNTRHIPIIFLSGLNDLADKSKGLGLGAIDFISKPIQPSELLTAVTHALQDD